MNTNFKIAAIDNNFNQLFNLSDEVLEEMSILKMIVDEKPGYPCRVTLEDAEIGEEVLLLSFEYHETQSPYKASGPIFIRKNSEKVSLKENEIPEMLFQRQQTLRMYDNNGIMIDAKSPKSINIRKEIELGFSNINVSYIQIHNTNPGCYNCQVNRVE
jgi:hypothetical protein